MYPVQYALQYWFSLHGKCWTIHVIADICTQIDIKMYRGMYMYVYMWLFGSQIIGEVIPVPSMSGPDCVGDKRDPSMSVGYMPPFFCSNTGYLQALSTFKWLLSC